jgi:crooked neck
MFEVRQKDLGKARKMLGQAIGMCPKDKLFTGYVALELKLFEFARCRTLYEKALMFNPANSSAWIRFAELERGLDDLERARAVYELAVDQQMLDMPELVWKSYIDFEEEEGEYERTRSLYERLLEKTGHVKVWISYAHFEINIPDEEEEGEEEERPISDAAKDRARKVFERAHKSMKERDLKEERAALLAAHLSFEMTHGDEASQEQLTKKQPRKTKRRRKMDDDTYEEYVDYVFPDEEEGKKRLGGLMEAARLWKEKGGGV